jgi:thioredoxin-related protein
MRIGFICLVLAVLGAVAVAAVPKEFFTTWPDAQKAAKAANKPIYLHFTTDWCGWCRRIESDTYANAKAKTALADYVAASLDCTMPDNGQMSEALKTNTTLFKTYGGSGYPYLVMLTPDGELLHVISGYLPPDPFVQQLQEGLARLKELRAFQAKSAKADLTSLDFQVRAFQLYRKLGQTANAAKAGAKLLELDPKNTKGLALPANLALLRSLPDNQWPDGATPIVDRIRALDPDNAKRALQEALMSVGDHYFGRARQTADAKEKAALLQRAADAYAALTTAAKTLNDAQYVYAMLGYAHLQLRHRAEAIANLQKAIDLDPNSRLGGQIKQLLKQAEALK